MTETTTGSAAGGGAGAAGTGHHVPAGPGAAGLTGATFGTDGGELVAP